MDHQHLKSDITTLYILNCTIYVTTKLQIRDLRTDNQISSARMNNTQWTDEDPRRLTIKPMYCQYAFNERLASGLVILLSKYFYLVSFSQSVTGMVLLYML